MSGGDAGFAVDEVLNACRKVLEPENGFEVHPFLIGRYDDVVSPPFKFNISPDTLSVLVLNTPCMFERVFKPWLMEKFKGISCSPVQVIDPLDQFMKYQMHQLRQHLTISGFTDVEIIYDFDLWPNRRPKILMQTCGHVSGAAYYYQPSEMNQIDSNNMQQQMGKNKKFLGLSLHPDYGGWFAYRAVIIFRDLLAPNLPHPNPERLLQSPARVQKALEMFNFDWRDWNYRDVIETKGKYSEDQKEYFGTMPADRWNLIVKWINN